MKTDGVPISPALIARLSTLGVDAARTFRAAGIASPSPANAHQPRLRVTTQKYFALWEAIAQVSGDPAIGLRIGAETAHGQLDIMSLAALHSANFRDALAKLGRYKRLSCPEEVNVDINGAEASVTFRWLLADGAIPDLLADPRCQRDAPLRHWSAPLLQSEQARATWVDPDLEPLPWI